jgi:hypothetical protein
MAVDVERDGERRERGERRWGGGEEPERESERRDTFWRPARLKTRRFRGERKDERGGNEPDGFLDRGGKDL